MSKEFEASFYAVEVELSAPEFAPELDPELSAAQISIKPSDRPFIQEVSIQQTPILQASTPQPVSASSQRCLAQCWHTDQEWEQGQRCLVACWQSGSSQVEIPTCQPLH